MYEKKFILCSSFCINHSFNISVFAQDRFAYAITDVNQNTASWTVLRKLNLQTGVYSDALLNGVNIKQVAYDAQTKKLIVANNVNGNSLLPFNTGVAAIAYDRKNNRLYFTPMFIDQLRYIDLETMKLYYVTDQSFTGHKIQTRTTEELFPAW